MQGSGKLVLSLPGGQVQDFLLSKGTVTLGRAAINDVVLPDARVSRVHAHVECGQEGAVLVDLGSANGTRVNGVRVDRAVLAPDDVIALGGMTLRFEVAEPSIESELTIVDSDFDLEATLVQDTLSTTLTDTRQPRLAVHTPSKTWEVPLLSDCVTIGREPGSDIVLDHPSVSRHHARIERSGQVFIVRDLQSSNGTWLGDLRVDEHTLQDGDTIRIGRARLVFKQGFEPEDLTLAGVPTPKAKRARRPVVFVPGATGSELWRGGERVWPNVRQLFSDSEIFRLPETEPLEARGLVGEVVIIPNLIKLERYKRLSEYLEEGLGYERGRDLLEFAYDWRQDLRLCAQRLAEAVDNWAVTPPITIIAHSMGCLVARYYVERLGGKDKVERLILLGGPQNGCPKGILFFTLGNLLPFGLLGERLREVLATFPAFYQILPPFACAVDQDGQQISVLRDETWVAEARRPLVRDARAFRRELGTRSSVPCVSVFGYGLKTTTGLAVRRDAQGRWQEVDIVNEPSGDATIPESCAIVEGSEIHPVQQHHGSLYVDNDVKMRLKLELTR